MVQLLRLCASTPLQGARSSMPGLGTNTCMLCGVAPKQKSNKQKNPKAT